MTDSGPDNAAQGGATRRPGADQRWPGAGQGVERRWLGAGQGAERRWARGEDQEPAETKTETDFTDNVGLTVVMPGGEYNVKKRKYMINIYDKIKRTTLFCWH